MLHITWRDWTDMRRFYGDYVECLPIQRKDLDLVGSAVCIHMDDCAHIASGEMLFWQILGENHPTIFVYHAFTLLLDRLVVVHGYRLDE